MPSTVERFTMKMNVTFTPVNFKGFLINIKDKTGLKALNFRKCKLIGNDHLDMLIQYGNGCLKRLKINKSIRADHEGFISANQFVQIEKPKFLERMERL